MGFAFNAVSVAKYIKKEYGNKDLDKLFDDENREQAEKVCLLAIREIAEHEGAEDYPLFTKGVRGERAFTPEMIDLDHIKSLDDLQKTIMHLSRIWEDVEGFNFSSGLVERESDEFPEKVKNITRGDLETFLKSLEQKPYYLWSLSNDDCVKIFYDLYRTYTGGLLKEDKGKLFLVCKDSYNDVVQYPVSRGLLREKSVFEHLTFMRAIKANLYHRELEHAEQRKETRLIELSRKAKSKQHEP